MSTETTAADDWAETFEGQVLDGRYEIEGLLGSGGMGAVFRGRQIQLRKPVAIKLLRPEYGHRKIHRERFLREARAASRIGHRNVVDISDFGETEDGRVFFVMELLEGEDLAHTLRREGVMPWRRARGILLQIVRALKAAHAKSVIHRDVKPANIFLVRTPDDEPDEVKVLDFGVAKVTDPGDSAAAGLTSADKVMGTAMYMAPEQALGKVADARSDVYAVGCVAYQMLAGRPAFPGTNVLEILMRRLNEPPPSLVDDVPHIAVPVEAFVRRAMARDPMARFQSMKEMEDAIRELAADVPSRGPEPPTLPTGAASVHTDAPPTSTSERAAVGGATPRGLIERLGPTPPSGIATESIGMRPVVRASEGVTEPAPRPAQAGVDPDMPATSPSIAIDRVARPRSRVAMIAVPVLAGLLATGAWAAWNRFGGATEPGPTAATSPKPKLARPPAPEPSPVEPSTDAPAVSPPPADEPPTLEPPTLEPPAALGPPAEEPSLAEPATDPETPPTTRRPKAAKPRAKAPPPGRNIERTTKELRAKAKKTCIAAPGTSLHVSFNIETSGKPAAVRVPSGTDGVLATCLRGVVRGARFGAGDLEPATLVVTW